MVPVVHQTFHFLLPSIVPPVLIHQ
jgi:hypothetical protein